MRVEPRRIGALRRIGYSIFQLVGLFGILTPLPALALYLLAPDLFLLGEMHLSGAHVIPLDWLEIAGAAVVGSAALYFGGLLPSLAVIYLVPRLARLS